MYRIGDIYKANAAASTLMLSNFSIAGAEDDFWSDYRTNHTNYDRVFNRMFNSFKPFMQDEDAELSDVVDAFRQDVYDHLLINQKKYEELYRVQVIPDEDYSLINNYDMQEIMDKDVTDNQDNTYGQRSDSGSFTKGSRQDSGSFTKGSRTDNTTNGIGQQTNTKTSTVAPYNSDTFANNTQDTEQMGSRSDTIGFTEGQQLDSSSFTEGQQLDSSSSTKGQQKDDLDRTYTEDYTLHRVGNIGVQTVSDMLGKHIKLWSLWEFYEYIFKEICKDLLLI